ncbi:alkaline phosphatase [Pseudomonas aeruginosa]|uniref:alkaline phosphatase n=1 Tax=Pseudomonas aeruginosa TaxID=287 RepID=UPI002155C392|nr:alkaline phosphatase [Pseudomonas aeruginosa]
MRVESNLMRSVDIPTRAQMTSKAIELLKDNPNGFFLQIESEYIDKQDHAAHPCGQIDETVDLDDDVQQDMAFGKADGETIVLVTE